jgi:hypothetical protein
MSKETPQKPRTSAVVSASYTHASVDQFIRDDLDGLTRRSVSLSDFLTNVLGFDVDKWGKRISEWKLHEGAEYANLGSKYEKAIKNSEVADYPPFVEWANFILVEVKGKSEEVKKSINLKLHSLGKKPLDGDFGKREPDVAGSNEGVDYFTLNWNETLFVFEFKRKSDSERKDENVGQGGSGSKKARADSKSGGKQTKKTSDQSGSK